MRETVDSENDERDAILPSGEPDEVKGIVQTALLHWSRLRVLSFRMFEDYRRECSTLEELRKDAVLLKQQIAAANYLPWNSLSRKINKLSFINKSLSNLAEHNAENCPLGKT